MWTPDPELHARYFCAGKDGDLWIGTNGGGLVHLQPRTVQMFTTADGLPSDIAMAVLPAHDGRLWVGENCGLAVFDGSHFRTFGANDGMTNSCVWSLAEDRKHTIWIGSYGGGLFSYRNGAFKPVSYTHLDVYKRQIQDIFPARRFRELLVQRLPGPATLRAQTQYILAPQLRNRPLEHRRAAGSRADLPRQLRCCLLYTSRCV